MTEDRAKLIEEKIAVDRKVAEIKTLLSHDEETLDWSGNRRYTSLQRRLLRDELADLKAESTRLSVAIARTPKTCFDHPDHVLFWFERAARESMPRETYEVMWTKAHEMRGDHMATKGGH